MTGYLALATVLLLLSGLVLALHRAHRRTGVLPSVDQPDRDRVVTEVAAIGAHADRPAGPARRRMPTPGSARPSLRRPLGVTGLRAAANQAIPWHRAARGGCGVDLTR